MPAIDEAECDLCGVAWENRSEDNPYWCAESEHEFVLPLSAIEAALDEVDDLIQDGNLIPFRGEDDWHGGLRASMRGVRRALLGPSENGDTDG